MRETYHEFDSHGIIEGLIAKGMTKELAEELTYVIKDSRELDLSHLVTNEKFDKAMLLNKHDLNSGLLSLENKLLKWSIAQTGIIIATLGGLITALKIFS